MRTPARQIHEAIVAILQDADLSIDGRSPYVASVWGEDRISAKRLPLVVVERPRLTDDQQLDTLYDRQVYAVPIGYVDACRAGSREDQNDADERLGLLHEKVKRALGQVAERNLRLPYLHCFYSNCTWRVGDPVDEIANNLRLMPVELEVPVVVERGRIWD